MLQLKEKDLLNIWATDSRHDVPEKERLSLVLGLEHFQISVLGHKMTYNCDQRSVKWMLNQKKPNKWLRHKTRLVDHDFDTACIQGNRNKVVDLLSRDGHYVASSLEKCKWPMFCALAWNLIPGTGIELEAKGETRSCKVFSRQNMHSWRK